MQNKNLSLKLYGLIDPRKNIICYIGITFNLKVRISQHNRPLDANMAPIAKMARYLKKKNMKLSIVLLDEAKTEEEACQKEIKTIKEFREKGFKLLNVQEGGQLTKNTPESLEKAKNTRKINKELGLHKSIKGENNPTVKFKNEQVLEIYRLIKLFYSNDEIIKIMNLNCSCTTITALRSGQNWSHLWSEHFTEVIPALYAARGGISARIKIKAFDLLEKGYTAEHIGKRFPRIRYDIHRAVKGEIWKAAYNVYNKFFKKSPYFKTNKILI